MSKGNNPIVGQTQVSAKSISSSIRAGELINITCDKDFTEFEKSVQVLGIILHVEKQDTKTAKMLIEFDKIAKHFVGIMAVGVILQDSATSAGSSLGVNKNHFVENYELLISMKGITKGGVPMSGDETAKQLIPAFTTSILKVLSPN